MPKTFNPTTPYTPPTLPPKDIKAIEAALSEQIMEARIALAELKGFSVAVPNPLLLLSPAILRESLASSEIENIHTTLIDVLENQLFPEREQREKDKEVLRYRDAILWGFEQVEKLAVSTRLIHGVHHKLMPTIHRGYRSQQNTIADGAGRAIYTPPTVPVMKECMSAWETFVNDDKQSVDPLVKAILGHYQFESIHPFPDGNGRTGRILMILELIQDRILIWPILYISGYINTHKREYYSSLINVTKKNDWISYIRFMLVGFADQAKETKDVLQSIMTLFDAYKKELKEKKTRVYSADLVESLFTYPIITPTKLSESLNIHYTTATRHLEVLKKLTLLEEKKVGKYRFFINVKLLEVLSPKKAKKN